MFSRSLGLSRLCPSQKSRLLLQPTDTVSLHTSQTVRPTWPSSSLFFPLSLHPSGTPHQVSGTQTEGNTKGLVKTRFLGPIPTARADLGGTPRICTPWKFLVLLVSLVRRPCSENYASAGLHMSNSTQVSLPPGSPLM